MAFAFDPYRVLNVPRDAESEAIRTSYRALAWQWHPDRGGSSAQMIQINEAWRVLGHAGRRAAHDAAVLQGSNPDAPMASSGPIEMYAVQRPAQPVGEPGVLNYGRYAGWSISQLADHDPDFLEWLLRMPAGRPRATEIREALARRERQAAELAPRPAARRSLFGLRTARAR